MPTAMVLGANGQDGTLVSRRLLSRGYRVVGIGLQEKARHVAPAGGFRYRQLDLRNTANLHAALSQESPDAIFHLAAFHRSAEGVPYEPMFGDMLRVNVESLHVVLEYLRQERRSARLVYAGSSKVFGEPYPAVVSEDTPAAPSCLYSQTKLAARHLIHYYRDNHQALTAYLCLFNHESELRTSNFFVPKLVAALRGAIRGETKVTTFQTLQFWCDWGSADEYMDLAVDVSERAPASDFVVATGQSQLARDVVSRLFERHGLDYRRFVAEKVMTPPGQAAPYSVDTRRLRAALGRAPVRSIDDICESMLDGAA